MEIMKYLCHAKRKVRMIAKAINTEHECKNECSIEGIHSCQTKVGLLLVHQESVKSFSRTSKKVSIDLANETKKRLLKSGKDSKESFFHLY